MVGKKIRKKGRKSTTSLDSFASWSSVAQKLKDNTHAEVRGVLDDIRAKAGCTSATEKSLTQKMRNAWV